MDVWWDDSALTHHPAVQYVVPGQKAPELAGFLSLLEQGRAHLGLTDVQMSLTSLEEVFLTIAKAAELEAAAAEGATKRSIPLNDGATLEVCMCLALLHFLLFRNMCASTSMDLFIVGHACELPREGEQTISDQTQRLCVRYILHACLGIPAYWAYSAGRQKAKRRLSCHCMHA